MTGVSNAQLLELSTKLLNAIHEQDSKLTESMNGIKSELIGTINDVQLCLKEMHTFRKNDYLKLMEIDKDINGNGQKGMKFQNNTMWDEHLEKKDIRKEVKIALILSVLSNAGLLASVLLK